MRGIANVTNGSSSTANGSSQDKNDTPSLSGLKSITSSRQGATIKSTNRAVAPTTMSTAALESQLRQLRQESQEHSRLLTQKLASSPSGQNLLHMGTSLSTLPPDLHHLLAQLHPVTAAAESSERQRLAVLRNLLERTNVVQMAGRRVTTAAQAATLYADLVAAERSVAMKNEDEEAKHHENLVEEEDGPDATALDQLDQAASLERAAHVTLCLVEELHAANQHVSNLTSQQDKSAATGTASSSSLSKDISSATTATTALPTIQATVRDDTEQDQFLMKLAPRIRKLESNATQRLSSRMQAILEEMRERQQTAEQAQDGDNHPTIDNSYLLLMLGHCMRGLVLLGRGKEVGSIFARVAVMPLVRAQVSMGRLDQGGARGACAGLPSLLEEVAASIRSTYGPVLYLAETTFGGLSGEEAESNVAATTSIDVDLLTAGVWVPMATAFMADTAIKMAIFSPGIASILQANYTALDKFLSRLATTMLGPDNTGTTAVAPTMGLPPRAADMVDEDSHLFYSPEISAARIQRAQERIYTHPKTAEFSKRWNLPIYYQLRFGECCARLNKAIDQTQREGWIADVFGGSPAEADQIKQQIGFELPLFLELYDILSGLWRPDVILRPLTNRFLRGAVQMLGRVLAFIGESMRGKILFGEEPPPPVENGAAGHAYAPSTRRPYCWGESEDDVAAVAWELTILESTVRHDYVDTVCSALTGGEDVTVHKQEVEVRTLVAEVLKESADKIHPLVDDAWNDMIVKILTTKCSAPLAAVKGVAATYRMTNRPPPSQASPFVVTILRPLKEFAREFTHRTPDRVGSRWKQEIVATIAERYAVAVDELITTVQRTEEALKVRRARRQAASGLTDGEKVKLQVYLDCQAFSASVREVGVDPASVVGLSRLKELTVEGETLLQRTAN